MKFKSSKLKRLLIGAFAMTMAVMQPAGALPDTSVFNTVVTAEAATTTKPGTTTLSKISSPAYNKITISWKKAANATHYVIYYKKPRTAARKPLPVR